MARASSNSNKVAAKKAVSKTKSKAASTPKGKKSITKKEEEIKPAEEETEEETKEEEFELPESDDSLSEAEEKEEIEDNKEDSEESDIEDLLGDNNDLQETSSSTTTTKNVHSITKSKLSSIKSTNKLNKKKEKKGVIYIGRLPNGFEEDELRKYFEQFGEITKLRLSRNKKTGNSKHYAFIEFESNDIAKIASETMNNYLLFNHLLSCSVIPEDKIHEKLFTGSNIKYKAVPWTKISQLANDKPKSKENWDKIENKFKTGIKAKQDLLKTKGFDYDLSNL